MKQDLFALGKTYSTTRLITRQKPVIENNPQDKFKTTLFLSPAEGRQGEGGLRTQGYFKKSLLDKPLITVITVVFNGERYLEETIQSVINQTYDNVEYIIIDGGSTDGTLDIIRKYEHVIDYWVSEKDAGIYDAMNKGIGLASGELLGILNSDDVYTKKAVKLAKGFYVKNGFLSVYYGDLIKFYTLSKHEYIQKGKMLPNCFATDGITINHPSCFVPLKCYRVFGGFDVNFTMGADRELMLRFFSRDVMFVYTNEIMAKFRLGGATSHYNLTKITKVAIEEYKLLIRYYSRYKSFKASAKCFRRGFGNFLLITMLGQNIFTKYRIFHLSKTR